MNRAYLFGAVALAALLVFAFLVPPVHLTEYDATGDEFRKTAIFLHDGRKVFPVSVLMNRSPLPAGHDWLSNSGIVPGYVSRA